MNAVYEVTYEIAIGTQLQRHPKQTHSWSADWNDELALIRLSLSLLYGVISEKKPALPSLDNLT